MPSSRPIPRPIPRTLKRGEARKRDVADPRAGVEAHQPLVSLVGLRADARLGVLEPRGEVGADRLLLLGQHLHGSGTLALVGGTGKRFSWPSSWANAGISGWLGSGWAADPEQAQHAARKGRRGPVSPGYLWGAKTPIRHAATARYSWMRPPNRSRRLTSSEEPADTSSSDPSGVARPSPRWGRWVL